MTLEEEYNKTCEEWQASHDAVFKAQAQVEWPYPTDAQLRSFDDACKRENALKEKMEDILRQARNG